MIEFAYSRSVHGSGRQQEKHKFVHEIKIKKELDLSKSEIINVTNKHPIGNCAKLIIGF